jgi:hypothetical protein
MDFFLSFFIFTLFPWPAPIGKGAERKSHRPAQCRRWKLWFKSLKLQRAAVAAGNAATTTAEALWTTVHGIKV